MWKKNFEGKREVSYKDFETAFFRTIGEDGSDDLKNKCLKKLILDEKDDHTAFVSLERFGTFLDWFGALDKNIMNNVLETMKQPWFFGDITREDSESKLSECTSGGYFLIRLSTNNPRENPFTLSMLNKKLDTIHLRIKRTNDNKLKISIKKHGKAVKIVEPGTIVQFIKKSSKALGLSTPVKGGGNTSIFNAKPGIYTMDNYDDSE